MAKMMVGSILATRSSLLQTRLTPTQKIKIEPISERYETASSVRASSWAGSVTAHSSTNTGMAEKMQPLPIEAVMTRIMTASSAAFAQRREASPRSPS